MIYNAQMAIPRIGQRRKARLYVTEWLKHRGLSDERAAGRLGVSRETIWKWRTQPHRLTTEKMASLASILDIEPEELYRPPNRPSLDALVKDQPADIQDMAADIVQRLVGRAS
jgi:transcriptional regulator with XRE-family HTH domain